MVEIPTLNPADIAVSTAPPCTPAGGGAWRPVRSRRASWTRSGAPVAAWPTLCRVSGFLAFAFYQFSSERETSYSDRGDLFLGVDPVHLHDSSSTQFFPVDYFDDLKNQTENLPSCCEENNVYSLNDQACISLNRSRTRHPFTGCGGENNTTIQFVSDIKVGIFILRDICASRLI